MSNFINRLEVLREKQSQQIAEKNKLEATIEVKKDNLKIIKQELEEKGLEYDTIEDLEQEITERKEYLEQKISNLERSALANDNLIQETQTPNISNTVVQQKEEITLDFDM